MAKAMVSFLSAIVFGLGLAVSGMTEPAKVIGFLDFLGNWDPDLIFVMLGAIAVFSTGYWIVESKKDSALAKQKLDRKLIIGSVIFGAGWGVAGLCPGPAITSLSSGSSYVYVFVSTMLVGIYLPRLLLIQK